MHEKTHEETQLPPVVVSHPAVFILTPLFDKRSALLVRGGGYFAM